MQILTEKLENPNLRVVRLESGDYVLRADVEVMMYMGPHPDGREHVWFKLFTLLSSSPGSSHGMCFNVVAKTPSGNVVASRWLFMAYSPHSSVVLMRALDPEEVMGIVTLDGVAHNLSVRVHCPLSTGRDVPGVGSGSAAAGGGGGGGESNAIKIQARIVAGEGCELRGVKALIGTLREGGDRKDVHQYVFSSDAALGEHVESYGHDYDLEAGIFVTTVENGMTMSGRNLLQKKEWHQIGIEDGPPAMRDSTCSFCEGGTPSTSVPHTDEDGTLICVVPVDRGGGGGGEGGGGQLPCRAPFEYLKGTQGMYMHMLKDHKGVLGFPRHCPKPNCTEQAFDTAEACVAHWKVCSGAHCGHVCPNPAHAGSAIPSAADRLQFVNDHKKA